MTQSRAGRPVGLLPRAADVVEAAQHPGDVAHPLVGQRALGQRSQRLALEVEQHPAALGGVQHLPEVVVAVDALQGGPVGVGGGAQHGVDRPAHLLELGAPRRPRPRSGHASRRRSSRPARGSWARCRARRPGCGAPRPSPPRAHGPARRSRCPPRRRAAPRARRPRRPGRNSWAKARCPDAGWSPSVPGCGQCPVTDPTTAGTRREPASTSAPWRTTSGFSPGESIRKTLTMSGVWWPSGRSPSRMTEVLDCSPESTREVRTCTSGPQLGCGTPATDSSTASGHLRGLRPAPGPAPARAAGRRRRGRAGRRRPSGARAPSAPSCRRGRGRRCRAARRGR